jgi:hypothetical protein
VLGFFGMIEEFLDFLLYWIPFYYPLKASFLVWCFLPQTKGSETIYNIVLLPIYKKHQGEIDAALEKVDPIEVLKKVEKLAE